MNTTNSIILSMIIFSVFLAIIIGIALNIIDNKAHETKIEKTELRFIGSKDFNAEDCKKKVVGIGFIYCLEHETKKTESRWFASKDFKLEEIKDCDNKVTDGNFIYCVE